MKNVLISLILVGAANFITAQDHVAYVDAKSETSIERKVKTVKNADFISKFSNLDLSSRIKKLLQLAADYDVRTDAIYTADDPSTYDVVFKDGNNRVMATYDQDGDIVQCKVKCQSVRLPLALSQELAKDYPQWNFKETYCTLSYKKDDDHRAIYKVLLKQGGKTKFVKIAD